MMSILSATRKGTRCGDSTGTHSGFTFKTSAIRLPMSTSKPSNSPCEFLELKGGKFGWMPMRITPCLMMSSRDFASAMPPNAPASPSASIAIKQRRNTVIVLLFLKAFSTCTSLQIFVRARPKRRSVHDEIIHVAVEAVGRAPRDEDAVAGFGGLGRGVAQHEIGPAGEDVIDAVAFPAEAARVPPAERDPGDADSGPVLVAPHEPPMRELMPDAR